MEYQTRTINFEPSSSRTVYILLIKLSMKALILEDIYTGLFWIILNLLNFEVFGQDLVWWKLIIKPWSEKFGQVRRNMPKFARVMKWKSALDIFYT